MELDYSELPDDFINEPQEERLDAKTLLSRENIDNIYMIEDLRERKIKIANMQVNARDLKLEKEFQSIIKAYDEAEKKLAQQQTKLKNKNAEIELIYNEKGIPCNIISNYLKIIETDGAFATLKFNQLSYAPERVVKGETVRWLDPDDAAARNYIESKYFIHSSQKLDDALRILFKKREYNPIKQIIEAVQWDGVERIPMLLTKWLKCENTEYTREVSRLVFSGGINRLYKNGCKFDDMAVLISTMQGAGKSTFVRWLALKDEFFTEVSEIEGQKGIEAIEGAWICEVAELLAVTKTKEVEGVKSYLSRLVDRYRRPFDKRVSDHKRQCVFIGTTNKEQFLTDKTGNRRFYPITVKCNGYELFENEAEIKNDILQCWAEAKAKYDKGEMLPYFDRKLLKAAQIQQQKAVEDDYREDMINGYLEGKTRTCVLELWQKALDNGSHSKPTKKDSNEIALILQSLEGWERSDKTERYETFGVQKIWKRDFTTEEIKEGELPKELGGSCN